MREALVVLVSLVFISAAGEGSDGSTSIVWVEASYKGTPFYGMTLLPDGRVEIEIHDAQRDDFFGDRSFSGSVDPLLTDILRSLLEKCPKWQADEPPRSGSLDLSAVVYDGSTSYRVHLADRQSDFKNLARGLIVLINNLITDFDLDSQNYLDVGLVDQLSRVYAQETRWLRVGLGILTLFVILQSLALVGIIWKQKR